MTERPILFSAPMVRAILAGTKTQTRRVVKPAHKAWIEMPVTHQLGEWDKRPLPYGKPGDRLWVREAWTTHAFLDSTSPRDLKTRSINYQADGQIKTGKTRPSIHMPRWASRITLEVTGVRVERLQDISEADAISEGMPFPCGGWVGGYQKLWESIHGPGSWDLNPWVWVVEFKGVAQ